MLRRYLARQHPDSCSGTGRGGVSILDPGTHEGGAVPEADE